MSFTVVVCDQFHCPVSPYQLQQMAKRGEFLTLADFAPGAKLNPEPTSDYAKRYRPKLVETTEDGYRAEWCTTSFREVNGKLEVWHCKWDSSG